MSYVDEVLESVKKKNASEPEFLQAVTEVLDSLRPVIDANEDLYRDLCQYFGHKKLNFSPSITYAERIIS